MPIRVLVVDDSAFMRHIISRELRADPQIEVIDTAADGVQAVQKVATLRPDVVTLDVEMPHMDGLAALRRIMAGHPTPVVMLSSLTTTGARATIEALQAGAVECLAKPSGTVSLNLAAIRADLHRAVHAAAQSRVHRRPLSAGFPRTIPTVSRRRPTVRQARRLTGQAPASAGGNGRPRLHLTGNVVIIGSSTGGPAALAEVVPKLPGDLPAAVAIVQHMPAGFTRSLAERLHDLSVLRVKEAEAGDLLMAGLVLVAPGGRHMAFRPGGKVCLTDAPPVHGVRPAVDVAMQSASAQYGGRVVGVVLTGMGVDGADGAALIRAAGGYIVVQDEATSVVYGMPRSVVARHLAHRVVPLPEVAEAIVEFAHQLPSR